MDRVKQVVKNVTPLSLLHPLLSLYHFSFAFLSALWYGFPGRKLYIIGVTGTKGKSTTVEIINAILEEAGYKTAITGTIRFKIARQSRPNLFKMTMPGRGFLQKFLFDAVRAQCTHAVLEITSEGARQFRNVGIPLNALVFTNIHPEHIESHGSYENYKKAKLAIGHALVASSKRPRILISHVGNELGEEFMKLPVEQKVGYLGTEFPYELQSDGISINLFGRTIHTRLQGDFNADNIALAALLVREMGIAEHAIEKAITHIPPIKGRVEHVEAGQNFRVVVDYAHTPESLGALYGAFSKHRKICVLGNTGGGRDTWKRPEMARMAELYCEKVILTNEDPYDEDPRAIVETMARGMKEKRPTIIMDRREAIREALHMGQKIGKEAAVLITGKGTDPYIMGPRSTKMPWSDALVTREELNKLLETTRGV